MGMLAGTILSKAGMDLSKAAKNPSKPGEKHHDHVIIFVNSAHTLHGSLTRDAAVWN